MKKGLFLVVIMLFILSPVRGIQLSTMDLSYNETWHQGEDQFITVLTKNNTGEFTDVTSVSIEFMGDVGHEEEIVERIDVGKYRKQFTVFNVTTVLFNVTARDGAKSITQEINISVEEQSTSLQKIAVFEEKLGPVYAWASENRYTILSGIILFLVFIILIEWVSSNRRMERKFK